MGSRHSRTLRRRVARIHLHVSYRTPSALGDPPHLFRVPSIGGDVNVRWADALEERAVIAWIYGGILSTGQAIVTSGETFASNYLFKVIVEPAETCIGDLDHNGIVDGADLAIVLAYWGKVTQPKRAIADLNDDGIVNGEDLTILLGDWGPCQ